jgi:hypothetical protein
VIGRWNLVTEEPDQPAGTSGIGGTYIPPAVVAFMKPKIFLEFEHDGACEVEVKMGGESKKARGKWRYVKKEGDALVLMIKMEKGEEREARVRFIDRNTMETVPPPVGEEEAWSEQAVKFERSPF